VIKGPFSWAAVYFAAAAVTAIAQTTAPTAASQQNSGVDQAQIKQGKATFAEKCSHCHGPNMINAGTITPDLRRFPDDNGWIASRRFTPAGYRAGTRGPVYERVWRRADKPGRKRRWHVILKKRKLMAPRCQSGQCCAALCIAAAPGARANKEYCSAWPVRGVQTNAPSHREPRPRSETS
jgi:hypothetical protein